MRGIGAIAHAVRTFQYSYVRWHARGSSLRRSRWAVLVRGALGMLLAVLVVVAVARVPASPCGPPIDVELDTGDAGDLADADLVVSVGRVLAALAFWAFAIMAAIVAMRRVVGLGQRRSIWMYPNWHRRIQGAVASAVGRGLLLGVLVTVLAVTASGACDVPDWFGVPAGLAFFTGLVLTVFGAAISTEAGWVAFALVVIIDLLSVCLLVGYALVDPANDQLALVGAVAFGIHATCTAVACRWSFVVGTAPGARADDRAKAGETGRSLCALWVLLLIAYLVVIFDETLVARAVTLLTSPVVVALTLGALAVTLGSGHTKYVEAREAAYRRARDRRSAKPSSFDRRDDLVPRIAVRMVAACGPLATRDVAAGVSRMAAFDVGERQLRRELAGSNLLVRNHPDDTWGLAPGVDPGPHRWPTDRALQELADRAGGGPFTASAIDGLLDDAGYRGLAARGYLRASHPLVNRVRRRWSVLPGRLLQ